MAQTGVQRDTNTGRICTILAFVFGTVSILFVPILFGPAAIVLAAVGWQKGDPLARYALPFAIVAMIAGFALGALLLSTANDESLITRAAAASR